MSLKQKMACRPITQPEAIKILHDFFKASHADPKSKDVVKLTLSMMSIVKHQGKHGQGTPIDDRRVLFFDREALHSTKDGSGWFLCEGR